VGHESKFIFGMTVNILSLRPNFHRANGGSPRASAGSCGLSFPGRLRLKIRSEYGLVLKTFDINEVIREIRLPVPYGKG